MCRCLEVLGGDGDQDYGGSEGEEQHNKEKSKENTDVNWKPRSLSGK